MRPDDHDPAVAEIMTGHWERDATYLTRRARGSRSWLLIHTLDGAGRVASSSEEHVVRAGDTALYRPDSPQEYGTLAPGSWRIAWAHFHSQADWRPLLPGPESPLAVTRAESPDRIARLLLEANEVAYGARPERRLAALRLEEALLWLSIAREGAGVKDARVRRVVERIAADPAHPWTQGELAAVAGLSPSHFGHRFRAETGESPRAYLERLRLERGRWLLVNTDLTLAAVAARLGFSDETYFSHRFRRATGLSPGRYRATTRG